MLQAGSIELVGVLNCHLHYVVMLDMLLLKSMLDHKITYIIHW